mmetsp:Transcript_11317/g.20690  ORF Transcript_11317/g.20690 Transcript_11317/m.20690 type:complete len:352 (-) Transcript_11317:8-1063(-)
MAVPSSRWSLAMPLNMFANRSCPPPTRHCESKMSLCSWSTPYAKCIDCCTTVLASRDADELPLNLAPGCATSCPCSSILKTDSKCPPCIAPLLTLATLFLPVLGSTISSCESTTTVCSCGDCCCWPICCCCCLCICAICRCGINDPPSEFRDLLGWAGCCSTIPGLSMTKVSCGLKTPGAPATFRICSCPNGTPFERALPSGATNATWTKPPSIRSTVPRHHRLIELLQISTWSPGAKFSSVDLAFRDVSQPWAAACGGGAYGICIGIACGQPTAFAYPFWGATPTGILHGWTGLDIQGMLRAPVGYGMAAGAEGKHCCWFGGRLTVAAGAGRAVGHINAMSTCASLSISA